MGGEDGLNLILYGLTADHDQADARYRNTLVDKELRHAPAHAILVIGSVCPHLCGHDLPVDCGFKGCGIVEDLREG